MCWFLLVTSISGYFIHLNLIICLSHIWLHKQSQTRPNGTSFHRFQRSISCLWRCHMVPQRHIPHSCWCPGWLSASQRTSCTLETFNFYFWCFHPDFGHSFVPAVACCLLLWSISRSVGWYPGPGRRFWEQVWVTFRRRCHSSTLTVNLFMWLLSTSNRVQEPTNHILPPSMTSSLISRKPSRLGPVAQNQSRTWSFNHGSCCRSLNMDVLSQQSVNCQQAVSQFWCLWLTWNSSIIEMHVTEAMATVRRQTETNTVHYGSYNSTHTDYSHSYYGLLVAVVIGTISTSLTYSL